MTTPTAPTSTDLRQMGAAARAASRSLATLGRPAKDAVLLRIADLLVERTPAILAANERDLERGRTAGLEPYYLDRLTLTPERIAGIAGDTRAVAALPDPVGEVFDGRVLANGLRIARRRVPMGVVACIYESRPNVTIDITALCLKSGNATVLRGGRDAQETNTALAAIVREALDEHDIDPNAVQLITDPDRALIDELLKLEEYIDLVIPRGGEALVKRVRSQAAMAVIAGGIGVVHTYVDGDADLDMALTVVDNAKTRRFSICNALDTLLVDESVASDFLPRLAAQWAGRVTLLADDRTMELVAAAEVAGIEMEPAQPEHWDTEHLSLRCGVRVVDGLDAALDHIAEHGSGHSEAILTENYAHATRFVDEVDSAAVYVNASTQFTDGGQFGLGAEVAISTGKAHARGPVGLTELTSYKWTVFGEGQVRPL